MAVLLVPRDGSLANFEFLITLEGVVFRLIFKHNKREDAWYFDLLDELQNPLRTSIKIVVNYPLLTRLRNASRPAGHFVADDPRPIPAPPALDELGATVLLTYVEGAA